ncbi:MAG: hypothetical protein ABI808_14270 [Pseudonocardiales bacterium]
MSTVENPHAGQGMVVLDIGGDIGALVVSAPATMAGLEIEICPSGARQGAPDEGGDWWQGDWHSHPHPPHTAADATQHTHHSAWPHVAVLGRPVGERTAHSAVFPGLRAGSYDVWVRPDEPTAITVAIRGGQVTTVSYPNC